MFTTSEQFMEFILGEDAKYPSCADTSEALGYGREHDGPIGQFAIHFAQAMELMILAGDRGQFVKAIMQLVMLGREIGNQDADAAQMEQSVLKDLNDLPEA